MKVKLIAVLITLGVIGGGAVVVDYKQKVIARLTKPEPVISALQVVAVTEASLAVTAHYLGLIEAVTRTELAPRITAAIRTIHKREGDAVRQGEELVVLDDRELRERYNAVRAEMLATREKQAGAASAFATQQSIYERDQKLFAAGAISRETLERSTAHDGARCLVAAYEESGKGLAMSAAAAATQAGYARIVAPYSGVVTRRLMEPGEMAVPGKAILTLEDTGSYKVTVELAQEELITIENGSKLILKNGDEAMSAAVTRLYPSLGKNRFASVETVLPFAPFQLPSGAAVGIELVRRTVTGRIVPENGVVRNDKGNFVYVVKEGVVTIRAVEVLGTGQGQVAVQGDLAVGEECAVGQENRLLTLAEGDRVKVVRGVR